MYFIVFSHITRFNYFLLFTFETSPGIDYPNSIHYIVSTIPDLIASASVIYLECEEEKWSINVLLVLCSPDSVVVTATRV